MSWATAPQPDLEAMIAAFKSEFPGWWYSIGECQVSCDASCGPTSETPDIARVAWDDRFNDGFHADLTQPSNLADALRDVMEQARAALIENDEKLKALFDTPTRARETGSAGV